MVPHEVKFICEREKKFKLNFTLSLREVHETKERFAMRHFLLVDASQNAVLSAISGFLLLSRDH